MATRRYLGQPGLRVEDLVASELGSKDLRQGRAAVFVKSAEIHEHPIVLHEYLATRLAHSIGIPVPFGELASVENDQRAWASAIVGENGQAAAPPDVVQASQQERHIFAGIAVFDVWILNPDRTDENLIWTPDVGLWAIDHEQAFNAHDVRTDGRLSDKDQVTSASPIYKEVTPDIELMTPWVQLIQLHGRAWARAACDSAHHRQLQSLATLNDYRKFLTSRATMLHSLVAKTYGFPQSELF